MNLQLCPHGRHLYSAGSGMMSIGKTHPTLLFVYRLNWFFQGLIYSGSQDRTIGVWRPDGVYCRGLKGHAHWVNSLAVNTAYVTRTGAFEPAEAKHTNVLSKDPKGIVFFRDCSGTVDRQYWYSYQKRNITFRKFSHTAIHSVGTRIKKHFW